MKPLPRLFYERSPATVAEQLLGKILMHNSREGTSSGRIVETEAYFGKGDPASRASRKRTKLNEIMWWRGGLAFVYIVHGHHMLNVTAEREGMPGAVLIRALEPLDGTKLMQKRRPTTNRFGLMSGPGKLTEAMGITRDHHGLDLASSKSELAVTGNKHVKFKIEKSHRIGVSMDLMRNLRFFIQDNPFVSR